MYGISLQPISHLCYGIDCESVQTCKCPYDFGFSLAATGAEAQFVSGSSIHHFLIRREAIVTLRNCNSTSTGCTKKSNAGTLEGAEEKYSNAQSSSIRKYSTPKKKKNYKYVPSIAIRKPEFETSQLENADTESTGSGSSEFSASEFIKTAPISGSEGIPARYDRPLEINLDLAVYRAKSLARKGDYDNAEEILRQCIRNWPENGRPYMILGRLLTKQTKYMEARSLFENGCQATQGENAFLWQGWAILEQKMGNITKARKLFDAAIVADKKHVAAWHGWAFLEINEGNVKKGRVLLSKGLKYCGPNEYIFQTLALLEVKAKRYEQARSLFSQAIKCNPKSCASWLAWAQLEAEQERNIFARRLFERAVQASPKNRLVWQNWALFETSQGEYDKARKLFRVGHALNPRDPVLLQSHALFEYRCSSATIAREIFKKAREVDPNHQPIWIAWGWMEWKEGNIATARELYQQALEIDSKSSNAARCLQAWGTLEEREGNIGTARRLFKSAINIDSQNFVTWISWAALEENLGNSERAEEIRNLYFLQRTEVVGDASWDVNLSEFFAPAINRIKGLFNSDDWYRPLANEAAKNGYLQQDNGDNNREETGTPASLSKLDTFIAENTSEVFDIDSFLRENLSLDVSRIREGNGPVFLRKNNKNSKRYKNQQP